MPAHPCPFEKRFPSQLIRDDAFFMSLAYNQAIDAWREDEVPIGAVIEIGGEVVAAAHNTVQGADDPTAHAEMLALTQAAAKLGDWRLEGATVYVTKEPCPMCSGAMLMSRVKRVCYAVPDPKMGCLGGATNLNDLPRVNHHLELTAGHRDETVDRTGSRPFADGLKGIFNSTDDLPMARPHHFRTSQ